MPRVPTHRIAEHPGAFLREQIEETGLAIDGVARGAGLRASLLREIACERRGVSAETAIALGAYFGQSPEFWMNAQKAHELSKALVENEPGVRARVRNRAGERRAAR